MHALIEVSQAWSGAIASSLEESAEVVGMPEQESLAVFAVGSDWFAVPAIRALQVGHGGRVQPVGTGQGRLAGAVPWRSHLLPLIRLQGQQAGRSNAGLMLVASGRRASIHGQSDTAVAIEIDAVDRLHWPSSPPASLPEPDAPNASTPTATRMRLGDGRVVNVIDTDALALEFAFGWSNPGSSMLEPASAARLATHGREHEQGRNTEPYLVYRGAEQVAMALSHVDEVLGAGDHRCSGEQFAKGTMVWRDQLLPVVKTQGGSPGAVGPGDGAVVVMRSGKRRFAMKVAAVHFILPAGAAQLSTIHWPGRGRARMLTASIDGSPRSFRIAE